MRDEKRVLLTDTTMRDAHQSLFATRMRTADMLPIAPHYAHSLPQLLSLECWGGATFDVALRFLKEDPWARLAGIRQAVPNVLLQMLLRGANAVGYTNYADNVVRHFVQQAAAQGMDVFRVFDSLNWVENMRVAMDAVQEAGALCEGTICYTGDLLDPARQKYDLKYYVRMAKQLEQAGAHIIGIKDMAGICRPAAASALVKALKEEVGLPLHFHTHDTSGAGVASVLAAVAAGVDAVDCAVDAMSGLTAQPSMGAIVAALQHTERDTGISPAQIAPFSRYWEGVRHQYAPFEADIRAGTADVYRHEMPGGQYTNLREQARSMGLEPRWNEVAQAYADANQLFGDIVKVTPSSKVVGDLALFMVAGDHSAADIANPDLPIAFPDSVVAMMRGDLGYPEDGFPPALQARILKGQQPIPGRAAAHLPPVDLAAERERAEKIIGHALDEAQLASWLMYPKVYQDYSAHRRQFGDVSVLPTSVFFYGMALGGDEQGAEEIAIDIDRGKTLVIRLLGQTASREQDHSRLLFELNGQPRPVRVAERSAAAGKNAKANKAGRPKAQAGNRAHVAAPMPGMVAQIAVKVGQSVSKGQALLSVEAMKMENSIAAERDGTIAAIHTAVGDTVQAQDLLLEFLAD
jgi:pyruvate carboxylase